MAWTLNQPDNADREDFDEKEIDLAFAKRATEPGNFWLVALAAAGLVWLLVVLAVGVYHVVGRDEAVVAKGPVPPPAPPVVVDMDAFEPPVVMAPPAVPKLPAPPAPLAVGPAVGGLPEKAPAFGVHVNLIKDPPEAFKLAARESKLVFMVHLSGNFDDPDFT